MMCALLAGTKTQTRRVLNPQPGACDHSLIPGEPPRFVIEGSTTHCAVCGNGMELDHRRRDGVRSISLKYQKGDRLYVREAWKTHAAYDDISPAAMGGDEPILYEADGAHQTWGYPAISKIGRFRQGMHMPRWASRLTLTVTEVRVQRLQEISDEDAREEGVNRRSPMVRQMWLFGADAQERERIYLQACRWEYEALWNSLNDARGFGWDANPWVVAVSFTVERRNIDQVRP